MRFKPLLVAFFMLLLMSPLKGFAITQLYNDSINEAIRYGLENQDYGMSAFMGGNWIEGSNGSLLNIYTPFMEIARATARKNYGDKPTAPVIARIRKNIKRDIDYIWQHQHVKFMVSLYGDQPNFAGKYFAKIEGVGRGRSYTLYPYLTVPQTMATKEENAKVNPYTAINAYYFKFDQVMPLDEFQFTLYGKDLQPIPFKVVSAHVQ